MVAAMRLERGRDFVAVVYAFTREGFAMISI
ncbi:hypothetical protein X738_03740 [Mesorhizobium sp. LNHC209A00]|jgi:hypothetical protein|nr:hypothetical protein X741_17470 [Mesorhizobium sp. LNHC229A00]ESZ01057.1 hypothetical protein X738_03740 [Mesorhizobium sp. LNHC209A00]